MVIVNSTFIDITGQKFWRFKVLHFDIDTRFDKHPKWVCECECGVVKSVRGDHLKSGKTKSCGCIKREVLKKRADMAFEKKNEYYIDGDFAYIKADNCEDYIVADSEDLDKLLEYRWHVTKAKYAKADSRHGYVAMHKVILGTKDGMVADHMRDFGDIPRTLNNTKANLRFATPSQNSINRGILKSNTSSATGVVFLKSVGKWMAELKINRKTIYLGRYDDFEDAVRARRDGEDKYFGEFSYYNTVEKHIIESV